MSILFSFMLSKGGEPRISKLIDWHAEKDPSPQKSNPQ